MRQEQEGFVLGIHPRTPSPRTEEGVEFTYFAIQELPERVARHGRLVQSPKINTNHSGFTVAERKN
jgi:hypothetical protein